MRKYDVIVVGAGTAGCLAGMTASKLGARVLMLDCKDYKDIGKKVCGDAVDGHHFDAVKLGRPPSHVLRGSIDAIRVYSPSGKHSYKVEGEGYALDRYEFGRWLLDGALDGGAELEASMKATAPLIEKGRVVGVKASNGRTGEVQSFFGDVVIDASGWTGAIRRLLPGKSGLVKEPSWGDVEVCYREVRELKKSADDPKVAKIHLSQQIAPGGYWWFFPQGDTLVNLGVGVKGGSGFSPKKLFMEHLSHLPLLQGSKVIDADGGIVPTRRGLHTLVAFGALIVGDAGFTANPIHGGGIGPSMISGLIAGMTAVEEPSTGLWRANREYLEAYGARVASLEVFRIFLQALTDDDLEFGMAKRLITEEDLARLGSGAGGLSVREKAARIVRGIKKPSLLRHLTTTIRCMKRVDKLYQSFPEEGQYEDWSKAVDQLFIDFRRKIGG